MRILDLDRTNQPHVQQAAELLVLGFAKTAPSAGPTLKDALDEMDQALEPGKICRVALDDADTVLGWVGAMPGHADCAWELHPLVVHPAHQRQGIGRSLVADLEPLVRAQGGSTLVLGSDDEMGLTSVSGVDLYPDVTAHNIQNLRGHPYEFYQKVGFVIVGLIPDTGGWGNPEIIMAKRLRV